MLMILSKQLPTRTPNIERVIGNVDALKRGLHWCKEFGHEVLSADIVGAKPEIIIETSPRCATLVEDGLAAEIACQVVDGVRARILCAAVEGCMVKWIEKGY